MQVRTTWVWLLIGLCGFLFISVAEAQPQTNSKLPVVGQTPTSCNTTNNFRPEDALYHNYPELVADVQAVVNTYPSLVQRLSIGSSSEGCDLIAVKISKNVATDEAEPEVLFVGGHHAREHLGVEMTLYLLHLLTENYGVDPRVTAMVDTREIYIVFN